MDLIFEKKIVDLKKSLETLEEIILDNSTTAILRRDVMVLRFLYTSEIFGKTIQAYLRSQFKLDVRFISDGYRQARGAGIFSAEETELSLKMLDDRNFCAHAYQENVIEKISINIPTYAKFMRKVFNKISQEK